MSAATAQIRALENTIFDKESINHTLQKQINVLEDQLSKVRSSSRLGGGQPSRPSSRAMDINETRRSSLSSHRPNTQAPLSRTIFDHVMTPETAHKRKVSLSMLKARIDSENKHPSPLSIPPSRALSPVHSENGHGHHDHDHHSHNHTHTHTHSRTSSAGGTHQSSHHRPQFLDESHVFWCHSCRGDLVIL